MARGAENDHSKGLVGQVVGLAHLLEYQEGAVVSRTIVERKTGTVTLFAFAASEGLSEHTAPFDALALLLEGQMEITISGRPMCVNTGEMVVMPADEPHALRALAASKMLLVMIRS